MRWEVVLTSVLLLISTTRAEEERKPGLYAGIAQKLAKSDKIQHAFENEHVLNLIDDLSSLFGAAKSVKATDASPTRLLKTLKNLLNLPDDIIHQLILWLEAEFAVWSAKFESDLFNDVAPDCVDNIKYTVYQLIKSKGQDQRMFKFFDAAGKPGGGILYGNSRWLGSYPLCSSLNSNASVTIPGLVPPAPAENETEYFGSRYCTVDLEVLKNSSHTGSNPLASTSFTWAVCVPDSCFPADVQRLWQNALNNLLKNKTNVKAANAFCARRDLEEAEFGSNGAAISMIVVGGVAVLLSFIGTLVDYLIGETKVLDNYVTKADEYPVKHSKLSIAWRLILAFSLYVNVVKVFDTRSSSATLSSIHGIRFISMLWVILAHTYAFTFSYVNNAVEFVNVAQTFAFQTILGASVSVDTFFMLSGMLTMYVVLKARQNMDGPVAWIKYFFHRYWRLSPPYFFVFGFIAAFSPFMSWGPFENHWQGYVPKQCSETWWWNVLYINNFLDWGTECIAWVWYLANDMQFHWVAPIIIAPVLYIGPMWGLLSGCILLAGQIIATAWINIDYTLPVGFSDPSAFGQKDLMQNYQSLYYQKPWCRISPYLVGLGLGFLLDKIRRDSTRGKVFKLPSFLVLLLWGLSIAGGITIVYAQWELFHGVVWSVPVKALWNTMHRTAWALIISWVVLACETGYGGFINTFLSWSAMVPLSRLTYCAYLVHPMVMFTFLQNLSIPLSFSHLNFVILFGSYAMLSYGIAFVVSMLTEAPSLMIEKIILPPPPAPTPVESDSHLISSSDTSKLIPEDANLEEKMQSKEEEQ